MPKEELLSTPGLRSRKGYTHDLLNGREVAVMGVLGIHPGGVRGKLFSRKYLTKGALLANSSSSA